MPGGLTLLEEDDFIYTTLVTAGAVSGSASSLQLVDAGGTPLPTVYTLGVTQAGNTVATGSYGYQLTDANASNGTHGLFVYFGLTQLDLLAGQTLTLAGDQTTPLNADELHAKLTGSGNLAIAATNSITLNNVNNDYRGSTTVSSGTLKLGTDHALGLTSALTLAAGTTVDVNGRTQTLGALNSAAGSLFDLNGGSITISDSQRAASDNKGGTVLGRLTGAGQLIIDPSVVSIDGANPSLSATTTLSGGSEAQLNNVQGLGSGAIVLSGADDKLTFATFNGSTAGGAFNNALSGAGVVQLTSAENITLGGDNSLFGGQFNIGPAATLTASAAQQLGSAAIVDNGMLQIDTASDWMFSNPVSGSGAFSKQGGGTLTVSQLEHSGATNIDAGTLLFTGRLGAAGAGPVSIAAGAALAGNGVVSGSVTNSGVIRPAGAQVGNTLTVNGNYQGNGGTLLLNTVLGGDRSQTDQLIILGSASGQTGVRVQNIGGAGASTSNGIQVIQTGGGSGVFTLAAPVVAGAFDYDLVQSGNNWLLRSGPGETPSVLRPEDGAYLGNRTAAAGMFMHTLRDRAGAENADGKSWLRITGSHSDSQATNGAIDQKTDTGLVQFGSDLTRWNDANGNWRVGLMAGYGHSNTDADAGNNRKATGKVDGYSVGVYGTWYRDAARQSGLYVDSWLQYGWYDNKVERNGLSTESYGSSNWTASVETGYTVALGVGGNRQWLLTPQLQLAYNGYQADDHTESNGTRVSGGNDDGVITRLGARLSSLSLDAAPAVQPFVELNWWNGWQGGSLDFDGTPVSADTPDNRFELKVGLQGEIAKGWQLWGNIGGQWGNDSYNRYEGMIGVKRLF